MSGTDVFGDIADLATALGVLKGGDINSAFFADPAATMGGTLRDATRRTALLQFLDVTLVPGEVHVRPGYLALVAA